MSLSIIRTPNCNTKSVSEPPNVSLRTFSKAVQVISLEYPQLFMIDHGAYNSDHIESVQCGAEHEAEGIAAEEQALGVNVIRTRLWLHACGFLGTETDVLIGEDAIFEVKYPFKYRCP
ncbi:hypothetical protein JTB14_019357 [Gonioctena quinquepunctata]|nr:hypothetical protein JTB14_019357 [Gonioctena quinquepunctata]